MFRTLRLLIRRLRNRWSPAALHCIGDSHASFFSGRDRMQPTWPRRSRDRLNCFRSYRIGPALAYNLVRAGTSTCGRERLFEVISTLPRGARVLLCFGEIDCRAHLAKQSAKHAIPVETVVESCVKRYLSVGTEIERKGFKVGYWQVPPPTPRTGENGEFPTEGTFEQRLAITRAFNRILAAGAARQGQEFVSIFDVLTDGSGRPQPHYFLDDVHLSQHAMPAACEALRVVCPEIDFLGQVRDRPPAPRQ